MSAEILNVKSICTQEALLKLLSSSVYNPTTERLIARAEKYQNDESKNVFALQYNGQYVGIVVFGIKNCTAEVYDIAVKNECKYKGYGRRLLTYIKESYPISNIIAETDDDAVGFYLHCGFKITEAYTLENIKRYVCQFECINPVISHYAALIDENNDPVYDPEPLREYMDKWDGQAFINELQLSKDKSVLEIGVGTGRLAVKVAPECGSFTGIDISPKTIERARENLHTFSNVKLICGDYLTYQFDKAFDVIYSSLTFMHIKDKQAAIQKALNLLAPGGRFVLSIDKNQQTEIDYGTRRITVFPDTLKETHNLLTKAGFIIEKQFETEFAYIFAMNK